MDTKHGWNTGYWVMALLMLLLLQNIWQAAGKVETVPYSEFEQALADDRIAEVVVSGQTVTGRLRAPVGSKTTLVAVRVAPDMAQRLDRYKVPYSQVVENTFLRDLMSWIVPVAVFFSLQRFFVRGLLAGSVKGG